MITRRGILFSTVAIPFLGLSRLPSVELVPEATLLSEESSSGFRLIAGSGKQNTGGPRVIVVPGVSNLLLSTAQQIRREAELGSWIVLESGLCFSSPKQAADQARVLSRYLNVELDRTCSIEKSMYITYEWPQRHLIRSFGAATALRCSQDATVASSAGLPVCSSQRLGLGGIVFLGSMLGPSLFAEDREAHLLCRSLLRQLQVRCAGTLSVDTSTTA